MYIGEVRTQELSYDMQDFISRFGDIKVVCFVPPSNISQLPRLDKRTVYMAILGEEYDIAVDKPIMLEKPSYSSDNYITYALPACYISEFSNAPVEVLMRCT